MPQLLARIIQIIIKRMGMFLAYSPNIGFWQCENAWYACYLILIPSHNKILGSWSIPPTYVYDIIREQYSDYIPWVLVPSVQYRGKVPSHKQCSGNVPMLPGTYVYQNSFGRVLIEGRFTKKYFFITRANVSKILSAIYHENKKRS